MPATNYTKANSSPAGYTKPTPSTGNYSKKNISNGFLLLGSGGYLLFNTGGKLKLQKSETQGVNYSI